VPLEDATATFVDESSALERMPHREPLDGVRHAVSALPEEQRGVVVLHYFAGCAVREIAEMLEIPAGTVKSRLHAARAALRDRSHGSTPYGWADFFERRELAAWMQARGVADASAQ
jgi:DNA-directed RNA polymerase specialized sigma24 family protein